MAEVQNKKSRWIRPWNMEKFDDLFNRDERFFSVLLKGALSWLNNNIVMYDKPINHFVFVTGSSYMYIESNGYEFSWSETSGEDWMYMQLPRCVVELGGIRIPTEELSSPFVRGFYERRDGDVIKGFNAQIRRLPIEMDITLRYEFGTFNESIIFIQEALDKLLFQKYFNIAYLGMIIKCSIEMPQDFNIQINPIDMTSTDPKQRTIELSVKLNSNYPLVDETTEIGTDKVIMSFSNPLTLKNSDDEYVTVWYNDNGHLVKDNGDGTTSEINVSDIVDEFGEPMTNMKLYNLFNYNKIPNGSTLFSGDITNTTDIINDVVYKINKQ